MPRGAVVPERMGDLEPAANETYGFSLQLAGAQLSDLIQLACQNRVHAVYEVRAGHTRGHLYFDRGQLVHAEFGERTGLDAVVGLLSLTAGMIAPIERRWPTAPSIEMSADALLLTAAQRIDEDLELRHREPTTGVVAKVRLAEASVHSPSSLPISDAPGPRRSARSLPRLRIARATLSGSIQQATPGTSADLADAALFIRKAADNLARAFGHERCDAVCLRSARDALIVFETNTVVGVLGLAEAVFPLTRKLGLE
jgi:hypothetical protein